MYSDQLNPEEAYLHSEEGFRSKPYRCSEGKLTIGIGWNLDAGISWEEAVLVLRLQVQRIRSSLKTRLPWFVDLNEARQAALVSMAFQIGASGLLAFKKTLELIKQGNYQTASREMLNSKWAQQTPGRAQRTAYMMRYGVFPKSKA